MKKISFFLMAVLFSFAASIQAAEVTETIAMKKFGGLSTSSYENVTKTGTSDLGTEMVAYAFNPTTGQVRGNKTAIAGASVTSKDDSKNWSLYNTQPMAGAIKSIKVTQTATGSNKFQNNMYVALGTTNQGAVTTVNGAQKNTTGTTTEFTFDIDETQGYTYFKLLSNAKFTSGSVAGVVVTVTYVTGNEDPDATMYTVTTKVNDETMGTVTGAGEYAEGKTATLTANPNAGYKFVNWSNGETANPLKLTVTEDVEITANFAAIPPMTCAEAAAAASGETVVLNPFDVVYVVKDAGYIYIKDESGFNLIYDFNLDDKLKAGDRVEGFVGVSSPYNGLPELKASVSYNELTVTPGTAPEPTVMAAAPTKAELNQYVKFENVTLTANTTFSTGSATNATMVVNGTNVTLRNNFKLAATLSKDKAYNIVGFVAIYNSTIQVYYLSAEEYVAPVVTYNINVNSKNPEWGTVAGAGVYEEGEEVTIVATPNDDYVFDCWTESGDNKVLSLSRTYTFTAEQDIALEAHFKAIPDPEVLSGKFSVAADKLVEFAPGNLQFHTGDSTWRFAKTQYIAIGERNINLGDSEYKGWIDMFGWSTANTYYGVNPSNKNELYAGEFVDWGNLFPGENWYTLSKDEWNYLLNTRENAANLKHLAKVYDFLHNNIDTVFGLLLLPDMFEREVSSHATLVEEDGVAVYHITLAGLANLEGAGAIFLPAAGRRTGGYGNMINYNQVEETDPEKLNDGFYRWHDNLNHYCYYWTSTIDENNNVSYLITCEPLGNDQYSYNTGVLWGEKGRYGQSVRLARETKIIPQIIEWELNGGELPTVEVPTNEELWEAFKPYYNEYYGLARADQPIDKVSTFAAAKMQEIMTDAASEYKWLGDYILEVAAGQGVNLPTDMAAANEGAWRWAVHAFFNATTGANGAAGTDFTEAGKPENWGAAYQAVHELVLPTEPVDADYTLPTPVKEGYIFDGWYDNAEGEGEPYTVLPAGWVGKLYAIWSKKIVYETVYFVNTAQWETVNAYAWNGDNNNAWPGVALEATGEVILGQTVYSFTAEQGTYTNIIFNNGNGTQTADLNWVAEEYYVYCSEVWTTQTSVEAVLKRWIGTWTIVGEAALLGVDWDPAYVGYDMQLQENGTLQYVLENTLLFAKTYEYKAAKDHNWDVSVPHQNNNQLSINKDGFYNVTFTLNPFTSTLTADAELLSEYKYIPSVTLVGDMNDWTQKMDIFEVAEDSLTASLTVNLEAQTYEFKIVLDGTTWMTNVGTMTRDNSYDWPFENLDGENNNAKIEADAAGSYIFTWNYEAKTLSVTYPNPAPAYDIMPIEMTNLEVQDMGDFVLLQASDLNMTGISVVLGVYADGHLHEGSAVDWNGTELPIVEGNITKVYNENLATDMYTGLVVVEFGEGLMGLELSMYSAEVEAIEVLISGADVVINEQTGTLEFTATWEGYPVLITVAGYEEADFKEYEGAQISELTIGDDNNWYDFAVADAVAVFKEGNLLTLEGEYKSWATGATFYVLIDGELPAIIEWELNGGELPAVEVPTNEELWEAFKPYYITFYNENRADQPITAVATFMTQGEKIFTDETSEYKWLGDYLVKIATEQGYTINSEALWRWHADAFFQANQHTSWPKTADFTLAGQPENWGPAYQAAHEVVLPTTPQDTDYTLPTPVKEGYIFLGWYDNAEGSGEAYTVIPAGWYGKLYALWTPAPVVGVDNIIFVEQPVKIFRDGQVLILKGDKIFNIMGQQVK